MKWKYKIDFTDKKAFEDVEGMADTKIPEDLKKAIREFNAASPEKNKIQINGVERIFGCFLSFNHQDSEPVDDVYTALEAINKKGFIPFGIDPFGNYFCYDSKTHTVAFWNHEENAFDVSNLSLSEFINTLS